MAEERDPTCGYWRRPHWWWVPLGWLWLAGGVSAVFVRCAHVRRAGGSFPGALLNRGVWFIAAVAFVAVSMATAGFTCRVLKQPWLAGLVAVLLAAGQVFAGYALVMFLGLAIYVWAGGPL
jgi:hypothetical protein